VKVRVEDGRERRGVVRTEEVEGVRERARNDCRRGDIICLIGV